MAYNAEEKHWLMEGFLDGYYEYNTDELMAYCEENCGFVYEDDDEDATDDDDEDYAKIDYFENYWLKDYVSGLNDEEASEFLKEHMNADVNLDDDDVEYQVAIPDAIIKMAEKKE